MGATTEQPQALSTHHWKSDWGTGRIGIVCQVCGVRDYPVAIYGSEAMKEPAPRFCAGDLEEVWALTNGYFSADEYVDEDYELETDDLVADDDDDDEDDWVMPDVPHGGEPDGYGCKNVDQAANDEAAERAGWQEWAVTGES